MVAGEHPQAPRINRQRLVDAELGREIRRRTMPEHAGVGRPPGVGGLHVFLPAAVGPVDARVQHGFGGPLLERLGRILLEQQHRVVPHVGPQRGIDVAKDLRDFGLPAPPQIVPQFPKLFVQRLLSCHQIPSQEVPAAFVTRRCVPCPTVIRNIASLPRIFQMKP